MVDKAFFPISDNMSHAEDSFDSFSFFITFERFGFAIPKLLALAVPEDP